MAKRSARAIDSDKLRAAVFAKGVTLADASRSIGMAHNAIGNWLARQEIPEYAIILLEKEVGIPYDEYKKDDPVQPDRSIVRKNCYWCMDSECTFPIDVTEGKLNASVAILGKRSVMELTVNFGSEAVITGNTMIKFCPFCGRELV